MGPGLLSFKHPVRCKFAALDSSASPRGEAGERPGRRKAAVATMMTGVGEGAVGVASANELSASTNRPNFLAGKNTNKHVEV
jgi:hypothetical protein